MGVNFLPVAYRSFIQTQQLPMILGNPIDNSISYGLGFVWRVFFGFLVKQMVASKRFGGTFTPQKNGGPVGGVIFLKDIFLIHFFTPPKVREIDCSFHSHFQGMPCDSHHLSASIFWSSGSHWRLHLFAPFFLRPENCAFSFLERFRFWMLIPPRLDLIFFLLEVKQVYIVYPSAMMIKGRCFWTLLQYFSDIGN